MESENLAKPRGIILCVLATTTFVKIRIQQLFQKTLHEKGYHVRSSMGFRGNGVGNGLWHGIVCRNEAILGTCVGPRMGSKSRARISSLTTGNPFFIFGVPRRFFFCEAARGAHFSIERNLHAVVGDCLRTTYHLPCVRVSFLGIHAASCGVPPNPLETDRI